MISHNDTNLGLTLLHMALIPLRTHQTYILGGIFQFQNFNLNNLII